jgi:hypothetical protein
MRVLMDDQIGVSAILRRLVDDNPFGVRSPCPQEAVVRALGKERLKRNMASLNALFNHCILP